MVTREPGDIDVSVDIQGIELSNPIMLASGILGETSGLLLEAHRAGAGAVVTKSIGKEPRTGHKGPVVFEYQFGLINSLGLPNPGIDEFEREMKALRETGAVVIGSIFGSSAPEFASLAKKMESYGASGIELNLSCPHARGYGAEIGSKPSAVRQITKSVVRSVRIPVFVKLTPNTSDICSLGLAAEEAGASAVVAINTVRAMAIDARMRRPVLSGEFGGLSGQAIKPIGLRCVYELYKSISIPIIGVGGITHGIDIAEYVMAGASAVQVGTVARERGLSAIPSLLGELNSFMDEEGFRGLREMRGRAHEQ